MGIWKIQLKNFRDEKNIYMLLREEKGGGYEKAISTRQAEIDALVYNINRATALLDEMLRFDVRVIKTRRTNLLHVHVDNLYGDFVFSKHV